jgi:hypothetical protein
MSSRYVFAICSVVSMLFAQDPYGRVTGRVVDSQGAAVAGVAVKVANVETNVSTNTISDSAGSYDVRNLIPGRYKMVIEVQGFKRYERGPFEVRVGDALTIEVALEVGAVTESITVTAEAPMLESASASVGQVVDSRRVQDLPMPSSAAIYLVSLAPGVTPSASPTTDWGPNNPEVVSGGSANGTTGQNEILVDGVPNMKSYGVIQYQPMPEILQEFRVQTAAYDASAGHSTGAQINMVTKSGTNDLHGALAFSWNGRPTWTRPFFVNQRIYDLSTGPVTKEKIDSAFPNGHMARYRASVTGPVYLPKLYNGRNRTFFTFGHDTYLNTYVMFVSSKTTPTAAQRGGDFSSLLALGSQYQLYDPATIASAPNGRTSRQPLPGNIIAPSRITATAKALMEYMPQPNVAGSVDGTSNYTGTPLNRARQINTLARVDHMVNDKYRFFVTVTRATEDTPWGASGWQDDMFNQHNIEKDSFLNFDNVIVPRADLVLNFRYGFMRNDIQSFVQSTGFDLASIGMPASLVNQLDSKFTAFPVLNINGYDTFGSATGSWSGTNFHYWTGSATNNRGAHSIRFGFDYRIDQRNNTNYGNVSPSFTFGTGWTNGPLDSDTAPPMGAGFAAFLLGLPTGGSISRNVSPAVQDKLMGLFVQDDWKLSRKLTVTVGLRYERQSPTTERYNRSLRGFDYATANPISAAALANYATSPIDEVPVTSFKTVGGLQFAGVNGVPRQYWNTNTLNFAPRIGLAYLISPTLVVRAGYGIFYETLGTDRYSVGSTGFSRSTTLVPSQDNGLTFQATLNNPFPKGILEPVGSSLGLMTSLGNSVSYFSPDIRQGYAQRWSLNVQREFPSRVLLDVGYVGNRGTRLPITQNFNTTPRQYLSTLPVRDTATINFLTEQVNNPFYGMAEFAGSSLTGRTVARSQLLLPSPQFTGVTGTIDAGFSWYHALQVRVEKRFTRGFTLSAAYTWSKMMQATSKLNATDPRLEHVISANDRPQRLVLSGIYDLPFGKGRRFLSKTNAVVDHVLGGWSYQAIYQGQSGPPIGFGNIIFTGDIHDIVLPRSERTLDRWFNTDAGFEKTPNKQLANNIRTWPSLLTGLRADGFNNWDMSLFKNFAIRENLKFQLRGEAQDAMNHALFASPNTSPTSPAFGQVTSSVSAAQRIVTVGGRLIW